MNKVGFQAKVPQQTRPLKFEGRYWFDTEFYAKGKNFDFISVGIVNEAGDRFYAVNQNFNRKRAESFPWVRDNVLTKLAHPQYNNGQIPWMTPKQIAKGILNFIGADRKPEFWAYNGSYDVVALCQLFGNMMGLRQNFERVDFYDIKQEGLHLKNKPEWPPKPELEHNALADAEWDKAVWEVYTKAN